MIIRASFFIVALVSAKVCQIKINQSRKHRASEYKKNEKATFQEEGTEKKNSKIQEHHVDASSEREEIQGKKTWSRLDSRRTSFSDMALLKNVVEEKEKESGNLEVRLIELYCLKEQKSRIGLLRKQLMEKTLDIGLLRGRIEKLRAEKEELYQEVKQNDLAEKELQSAKMAIFKLQAERELGAEQFEGQLMQMKEQVLGICQPEENRAADDSVEKKMKRLKFAELKAMKMKRRNIELQLDKRELVIKLISAKAKIAETSSLTENKVIAKLQGEISRLKHENNYLVEEIDKLHKDRFGFVEELVYQRWLNRCLRFELEQSLSPAPEPKITNSSDISTVDSSDELTISTTLSSSNTDIVKKKKHGLMHSLKRWASRKQYPNANAPESKNAPRRFRRFSSSSIPGSLSGLRNMGKSGLVSGSSSDSPEISATPRARRVSFNDSINTIRYIYEDRPEPDHGASSDSNTQETSDKETSAGSEAALDGKKEDSPMAISTGESEVLEEEKDEIPSSSSSICCVEDETTSSGISMFSEVMVNLIVGVLMLALFLLLVYFRLISAFNS